MHLFRRVSALYVHIEIVALITVRRKGLLFSFEIRFVDSCSGMFFFLCFVIARCDSTHPYRILFPPSTSHPKNPLRQ